MMFSQHTRTLNCVNLIFVGSYGQCYFSKDDSRVYVMARIVLVCAYGAEKSIKVNKVVLRYSCSTASPHFHSTLTSGNLARLESTETGCLSRNWDLNSMLSHLVHSVR